MLTSRRRRLRRADVSGAAARRLLDGSDEGPSALPQLLAAAAAPATDAELQGEAAARAAFRSSAHATPVPLRSPRRTRARTATAIVTAKILAAIALTAGTAGGVALATSSYSAHLQQNPAVRGTDTATFGDSSPSAITAVPSTQAPDGALTSDSFPGPGEPAGDGTVSSPGTEAGSRGPIRRCEALCTTKARENAATPSEQAEQLAGNPRADTDNEPEKNLGNGNNSDKQKNANNPDKPSRVNGSGKEENGNNGKGSDKGGNSDGAKNADKKDKADGDSPSGSGSKKAGADKGSDKKKTDA